MAAKSARLGALAAALLLLGVVSAFAAISEHTVLQPSAGNRKLLLTVEGIIGDGEGANDGYPDVDGRNLDGRGLFWVFGEQGLQVGGFAFGDRVQLSKAVLCSPDEKTTCNWGVPVSDNRRYVYIPDITNKLLVVFHIVTGALVDKLPICTSSTSPNMIALAFWQSEIYVHCHGTTSGDVVNVINTFTFNSSTVNVNTTSASATEKGGVYVSRMIPDHAFVSSGNAPGYFQVSMRDLLPKFISVTNATCDYVMKMVFKTTKHGFLQCVSPASTSSSGTVLLEVDMKAGVAVATHNRGTGVPYITPGEHHLLSVDTSSNTIQVYEVHAKKVAQFLMDITDIDVSSFGVMGDLTFAGGTIGSSLPTVALVISTTQPKVLRISLTDFSTSIITLSGDLAEPLSAIAAGEVHGDTLAALVILKQGTRKNPGDVARIDLAQQPGKVTRYLFHTFIAQHVLFVAQPASGPLTSLTSGRPSNYSAISGTAIAALILACVALIASMVVLVLARRSAVTRNLYGASSPGAVGAMGGSAPVCLGNAMSGCLPGKKEEVFLQEGYGSAAVNPVYGASKV